VLFPDRVRKEVAEGLGSSRGLLGPNLDWSEHFDVSRRYTWYTSL